MRNRSVKNAIRVIMSEHKRPEFGVSGFEFVLDDGNVPPPDFDFKPNMPQVSGFMYVDDSGTVYGEAGACYVKI